MKQNNTLPPDVTAVQITDERLTFELEDGRFVGVPLAFYPFLLLATPKERTDFEICHSSVYWRQLDVDLSSDCLLRGAREGRRYAERAWRSKRRARGHALRPHHRRMPPKSRRGMREALPGGGAVVRRQERSNPCRAEPDCRVGNPVPRSPRL